MNKGKGGSAKKGRRCVLVIDFAGFSGVFRFCLSSCFMKSRSTRMGVNVCIDNTPADDNVASDNNNRIMFDPTLIPKESCVQSRRRVSCINDTESGLPL
ncbi:hypothetical protein HDV57DRAFT_329595 [Trichoderma longibrachiatum]|uniref:Uncharacterized protein n=1 Tax=Trichoderma longibrachiatum ATCC 18648 TaxID=983965 RepID=A0A2T4BVQ1_TRILO|nr:hypothetical protein M440DRAFT_129978 [Trichoderma longibrachiatum ATCC 18648]